jgi:TP901 family phage tail tape measure protein
MSDVAGAQELETLVVKLMADASQYQATLQKAEAEVTATVAHVEAETMRLAEAAKRVIEATTTPTQAYAREVATLRELLDKEMISQEQFNRAMTQARDILPETVAAQKKLNAELAEAARVTRSVMTEEEKYKDTQRNLNRMLRDGDITMQTYLRALQQSAPALRIDAAAEEAAKQAAASRQAVLKQGIAVTEQVATATQRYEARLMELNGLLTVGAITQQTFNQAQRQAAMTSGQLGQKLMGLQTVLGGLQGGLQSVGQLFTVGITAPVTAMAVLGVKEFATFDDAMNRTFAVMGNVTTGMQEEMKATATTISNSSITSADDLANAYYTLAQAGMDAEQSQKALGIVNKFAVAGNVELQHAAERLIDVQRAMGMQSDDAEKNAASLQRVADVVMRASIETQASAEDFAKSLSTKVGAKARQLGKDIEEVTATLMAFASQGVKAQLAGEQNYIVLRDLTTAALKNKDAWEALGLSVYDEAHNVRDTGEIIQELTLAMAGLSDEQKVATMSALGFKDRSSAATNTLLGMGEAMAKFQAQLRGASGDIDIIAAKIEGSFLSQIKQTWNQLKNVAREIGQVLVPYIKMLNDALGAGLTWWQGLSAGSKELTVWLGLAAAAIGPLVLGMAAAVGAIGSVLGILGGLVLLGPEVLAFVGWVAAWGVVWLATAAVVVGAIGAIVYALYDPEGFSALAAKMAGWVMKATTVAMRLFTAFAGWLSGPFVPMVGEAIQHVFTSMVTLIANAGAAVYDAFVGLMRGTIKPQEFLKTLFKDANDGASERNFVKTAGNILKEEFGAAGEESAKTYGEGLNKGLKEAAAAAAPTKPEKAVTRDNSALLAMAEDAKDAKRELEGLIKKQELLEHTVGMNARQVLIYRMSVAGATEADLAAAKAFDEKMSALEAFDKSLDAMIKEDDRRAAKAAALAEKHASPTEKIVKEQQEVIDLYNEGLISLEAYNAEIAELNDKLHEVEGEKKIKLKVEGLDAVEGGTAEALDRIEKFRASMAATIPKPTDRKALIREAGKRGTPLTAEGTGETPTGPRAAGGDAPTPTAAPAPEPTATKVEIDPLLTMAIDMLRQAIEENTENKGETIELAPAGID